MAGKLQELKKDSLNDDLASTFLNKQYQTCKTPDELILYRVFGLYGRADGEVKGARSSGGYASTEFAESLIDVKLRLALDPKWFSTKAYEEKILLPKGSIINVGIVAPVTLKTGAVSPGGADQILLPKDRSEEDWTIGYRRVTARQLINPLEVEGSKGNRYIMRFHCNNSKCGYYW